MSLKGKHFAHLGKIHISLIVIFLIIITIQRSRKRETNREGVSRSGNEFGHEQGRGAAKGS